MKFNPTKIEGVRTIALEKREDDRGFLARTWCKKEFLENGIDFDPVQGYVSHSKSRGTLRGLHYQTPDHPESKLMRVTRGSLYQVAVDLRKDSPTYKKWEGFTFHDQDYTMLFVPAGCATGFITLEDNTEILNLYSVFYDEGKELGLRWDDPAIGISWPHEPIMISDKDKSWQDYKE